MIEGFSDFAIDERIIITYLPKTIEAQIIADAVYPKVKVQPREGINFTLLSIEAVRVTIHISEIGFIRTSAF